MTLSHQSEAARWLQLHDAHEIRLRRAIAVEKNRHIAAVAKRFEAGATTFHLLNLEHRNNLQDILSEHLGRLIPVFGQLQADQLRQAKSFFDRDVFYLSLLERWLSGEALASASGFAKTTGDDIVRVIEAGVAEGLGSRQIAAKIRKVAALSPFRAEAIARTETHNAASFASAETAKQAQKELGLRLLKFWVPTLDERTRANHAAMTNHKGIELDDKFNVGGIKMDRPGDPAGGAANVINCRCVQVVRESDYEFE